MDLVNGWNAVVICFYKVNEGLFPVLSKFKEKYDNGRKKRVFAEFEV